MKYKILIVDDEINILDILNRLLTAEGYEVHSAQNAEEFKKSAPQLNPNLIILDIMLGDKNGVQVYDELIMKGLDRNIPVIFLSGLVGSHQASLASPGRIYALMAKPFKHQELLDQIKTLLV